MKSRLPGTAVIIFLVLAVDTRAADTVETWAVGASDVEFYLSAEGLGRALDERRLQSSLLAGYGLTERLSAFLGMAARGDGALASAEASLSLGLFGTLVESAHFDLDLFLEASVGGPALSRFQLLPALEINLDHHPGQQTCGAYLRLGLPVHGQRRGGDPAAPGEHQTVYALLLNPGIYVTVAAGHQLLLEYDMSFHSAEADEHSLDIGGVALGYNVVLTERLELITQLYLDIPGTGEGWAAGVLVGLIATLPAGG
ncbi:MAG: hypothetical protein DRI34_05260 [Deltaproteobacteria bacterium]|nr:MAG: hypothetical protein DRI34_05260 [Deltaproteobacteria bacterium]